MKLTILQDDAIAEDEIIIRTATRHPRLERLIDLIKQYSITLKAYHNNREYYLPRISKHMIVNTAHLKAVGCCQPA